MVSAEAVALRTEVALGRDLVALGFKLRVVAPFVEGKMVRIAGLETRPTIPRLSYFLRKLAKYNQFHKVVSKPPEPIKETLAHKVFLNFQKMLVFSGVPFLNFLSPSNPWLGTQLPTG